jgi:RNAse (barnase) inhibitor barstar
MSFAWLNVNSLGSTASRRRLYCEPYTHRQIAVARWSLRAFLITCVLLSCLTCRSLTAGTPQVTSIDRPREHNLQDKVIPILQRVCFECHSGERTEAEIDFSEIRSLADVRTDLNTWVKVREILSSQQMPPPDALQPTAAERDQLRGWVEDLLRFEATAHAGDPGPVILRRLTNSEYNYAIQDLTGLISLDPTREFPVDGAAGEGFTNTGSAQSMSPALVTKYLDAARSIASHTVLLPDGIGFSRKTTRRDQADELLHRIRDVYRRYTDNSGSSEINIQGIPLDTNGGGRLPLQQYLTALLQSRDALNANTTTLAEVARSHELSVRYLTRLWDELNLTTDDEIPLSSVTSALRERWNNATAVDATELTQFVTKAQSRLWKFNTIGHIGREGGPTSWMEPDSPIVSQQEFRIPLSTTLPEEDVTVWFSAIEVDRGKTPSTVVWQRPRLEYVTDEQTSTILLRDLWDVAAKTQRVIASETPRTTDYLQAVADLQGSRDVLTRCDELAVERDLNSVLLKNWAIFCGLTTIQEVSINGRFPTVLTSVNGFPAINGWGGGLTPSLLTNRSDEPISFLTLTIPARGVTVHPSPELHVFAAWQAPVTADIRVSALVADADDKCGNGAAWWLEVSTSGGTTVIDEGKFPDGGRSVSDESQTYTVQPGDVVALIVDARDRDHVCDTTHIELTIVDQQNDHRVWQLSHDVVDSIRDGNPQPDSFGHDGVWHFGSRPSSTVSEDLVPPRSALAEWRSAIRNRKSNDQIVSLARAVQNLMAAPGIAPSEPNQELRDLLLNWSGPLHWTDASKLVELRSSTDTRFPAFGERPDGLRIDADSLACHVPGITSMQIPAQTAVGAEFVVTGTMAPDDQSAGCVQLQVLTAEPNTAGVDLSRPIITVPDTEAERRLHTALERFRSLFPAAVCYQQIVPVDEVVTLTLFHREDDHLKRLMLTETESMELDRLWDALRFVSQEPIALTVAFEQISEFATQDRPDLVIAFAPLKKPINERADKFRQRLLATESLHLNALTDIAVRAWRRPLSPSEESGIRSLYKTLRDAGLTHDAAIQRSLTRILTSPTFLYRHEKSPDTATTAPVSASELAVRLSFFLWSSVPDAQLRQAAASGKLTRQAGAAADVPGTLAYETHRMLQDARSRRLAIHFACQWLHVRDFDQFDDKNEQLYPQFQALRSDMYEETVLFFEDLFQNDGSVLDILAADHTFLNEPLAVHYGIEGFSGSEWQRVSGMTDRGRGGILGMSTVLASQSGASRTSPILRGNWISETLLGERLPRPPANVPQLPEVAPAGLTDRELIEKHTSVPGCADCHSRIDPYGFALEQFDTIGHLRGDPVDTRATLPDGTEVNGLNELRKYLSETRRDAFVAQFCRKLLGYALGREIQLSDELLLETMRQTLALNNYRIGVAIEAIVTSDQFRNIRGQNWSDE